MQGFWRMSVGFRFAGMWLRVFRAQGVQKSLPKFRCSVYFAIDLLEVCNVVRDVRKTISDALASYTTAFGFTVLPILLLSSSFLWFVFRILYGNPKKVLLRGLWVGFSFQGEFSVSQFPMLDWGLLRMAIGTLTFLAFLCLNYTNTR